jgi:cyclic pyranopterin phosphate synthase
MPPEGLDWLPRDEVLRDEEIVRLIAIGVEQLGIREVRFTGGEPLLRPGLVGIVAATAALRPRPAISLTTNAIGLARRAADLAAAGLDRVNVSLDTLDPARFKRITLRDRHADVLAGLAAAAQVGLTPVKVNAVLLRDVNDDEPHPPAVLLGPRLPPPVHRADAVGRRTYLGPDPHGDGRRDPSPARARVLPAGSHRRARVSPAERWLVDGGPCTVGVIGSVTRPFCGACDRTRLTADGQIRNCLFARTETICGRCCVGAARTTRLRNGGRRQWPRSSLGMASTNPDFLQPARPMSAIGG